MMMLVNQQLCIYSHDRHSHVNLTDVAEAVLDDVNVSARVKREQSLLRLLKRRRRYHRQSEQNPQIESFHIDVYVQ